jgi:transcription antitermination factor NusG
VLRTIGVRKFAGAKNTGSPVDDSEIDSIRILAGRGVPFYSHPSLNVGQRVRIRGGSLDGVEGILSAKNRDLSLVVSIQLIQRSLAVEVSGYKVEAA